VLGLIAPTVGIMEGRRINREPGITGNEPGTANRGNQPSLPPQKEVRPQVDQRSHSRFTLRIPSLSLIILKAPSETYLNPENLAMARIIMKDSQENEIVFIPSGIMGCFVTATTGRPQTLGMWQEVASDYEPDPKSASIFVFPKDRRAPSQLIKVGETEQWGLYRAPEEKTVVIPEAAVSTKLVYSILLLAAGAVVYDLLRNNKQKRR
jgi:hypothetical protein